MFVAARKSHPALRIGDLDDVARQLASAGHEPRWSDELEDRRFHADDCFGNRIEFIEA